MQNSGRILCSRLKSTDRNPLYYLTIRDELLHIYSLENKIREFFETQASVTHQQCDDLALSLVESPITPSSIQGAFSYTVAAGAAQSKIMQFRAQTSLLNMGTPALAQNIHPQFVAAITFHGTLGMGVTAALTTAPKG